MTSSLLKISSELQFKSEFKQLLDIIVEGEIIAFVSDCRLIATLQFKQGAGCEAGYATSDDIEYSFLNL